MSWFYNKQRNELINLKEGTVICEKAVDGWAVQLYKPNFRRDEEAGTHGILLKECDSKEDAHAYIFKLAKKLGAIEIND